MKRVRGQWLLLMLCGMLLLAACSRPVSGLPLTPSVPTATSIEPPIATPEATDTVVATMPPSPTSVVPRPYTGTPTPNPNSDFCATVEGHEQHIVQPGETLFQIALVTGCTVDELVAANGLADEDSISVGQQLIIPVVPTEIGPDRKLVPDSELVYGPAFTQFSAEAFIGAQNGYLAGAVDKVEGEMRTGPEIVQLVAQRFSVGPRVLLTLLELQSGWVTCAEPAPETLDRPLGFIQGDRQGLFAQLSWAADRLNRGYYGLRRAECVTMHLQDGTRVGPAGGLNPGTVGVQYVLAGLSSDMNEFERLAGPDGFAATYHRLFGDPFSYGVEPLLPSDLAQPELRLPWEAGEMWYYTGGPHGGWADGSGWAAVDFVPGEEQIGCAPSAEWAVAAAPGVVVRSESGEVLVDLDGDGFEQTGWVLLYMHIHAQDRVEVGTVLERGDRIGHPSCEGGFANATHLHLARRYNGEWVPAGRGPVPMVLSGWTVHEASVPYDGTMSKDGQVRTACECWKDDFNGLVSDNAP